MEERRGLTKHKMKRDIKEWELKEVRPITSFSVAFKDAWDRWQLQTISHHRAASSQEEIRDSCIQAPVLRLPPPAASLLLLLLHSNSPHPPPRSSHHPWFSQPDRFDVTQCEQAAAGHGVRHCRWDTGARRTAGSRLKSGSISGALRCAATFRSH